MHTTALPPMRSFIFVKAIRNSVAPTKCSSNFGTHSIIIIRNIMLTASPGPTTCLASSSDTFTYEIDTEFSFSLFV